MSKIVYSKLKFLRVGLLNVQYSGFKNWDVTVYGNIEIYFDKKRNSKRIRKIIKNL